MQAQIWWCRNSFRIKILAFHASCPMKLEMLMKIGDKNPPFSHFGGLHNLCKCG